MLPSLCQILQIKHSRLFSQDRENSRAQDQKTFLKMTVMSYLGLLMERDERVGHVFSPFIVGSHHTEDPVAA